MSKSSQNEQVTKGNATLCDAAPTRSGSPHTLRCRGRSSRCILGRLPSILVGPAIDLLAFSEATQRKHARRERRWQQRRQRLRLHGNHSRRRLPPSLCRTRGFGTACAAAGQRSKRFFYSRSITIWHAWTCGDNYCMTPPASSAGVELFCALWRSFKLHATSPSLTHSHSHTRARIPRNYTVDLSHATSHRQRSTNKHTQLNATSSRASPPPRSPPLHR